MTYKSIKRQISRLMKSTFIIYNEYEDEFPREIKSHKLGRWPKTLIKGKELYQILSNKKILSYLKKYHNIEIDFNLQDLFNNHKRYFNKNEKYSLTLYTSNLDYMPNLMRINMFYHI